MRDIKLVTWCKWYLPFSGILCSLDWYFVTDISGQPIGPTFNRHTVQEEWWEHLGKQLYTIAYLQVSVPGILLGLLEDRTNRLYWNVGKKLPIYAAKNPRTAKISSKNDVQWVQFANCDFCITQLPLCIGRRQHLQ